jgi:mono/diheme cytochrome c family protein
LSPRCAYVLVLLSYADPARAQDPIGAPAWGRALAESVCAGCHAVGREDWEPGEMEAPPFRALADDPAVSEMALRVLLRTPHETVPSVRLTPEEVDDLVAYVLSLKGPRSPR